jgi:hypothetical protein
MRCQCLLRRDSSLFRLGATPYPHLSFLKVIAHSAVNAAHYSAETSTNSRSRTGSRSELRSGDRPSSSSLKGSDTGACEHLVRTLDGLGVTAPCRYTKRNGS